MKRFPEKNVRLMFQDEAGFGRINKPRSCWISDKMRPTIAGQHIREYRYAYGAVDPMDGENYFIIAPACNSDWMGAFLSELSTAYPDDHLILVMDNAVWHKAKAIHWPENIECAFIPPYTPEMNPIEQIWKELRKSFANKFFKTLKHVINHLEKAIYHLNSQTVISITQRDWISDCFSRISEAI